jgi:GH18 family chitinase
MTESQPFRVIAYVTAAAIPELIPYEKLTHINYAFLIPNPDGSFAPMANRWKLQTIAAQAHEHGVQVLISVGGGKPSLRRWRPRPKAAPCSSKI